MEIHNPIYLFLPCFLFCDTMPGLPLEILPTELTDGMSLEVDPSA
jgi:hypothetical protein